MSWTERSLAITVVGNPGLDTLVLVGQDDPDLRADGHYVTNVDTVGHAAAFAARGLARLGHHVRILGAVGDDPIGRMVADVLAADEVDTSLLFTDPAGTARSVNFVFPDGRRTFFYDGGSHMTLTPSAELVDEALEGADLWLSCLPNWARNVLPLARTRGIEVAVDLQDVRRVDDPYRAGFIADADLLFASAAHLGDPVAAARRWSAAGPVRQVVFGLGARGALLVRSGTADTHVLRQPPVTSDLPIVDTTGCGDSLAAGVLDGQFALRLPDDQALHRGQTLARIVASATGNTAPFTRAALDLAVEHSPLRG